MYQGVVGLDLAKCFEIASILPHLEHLQMPSGTIVLSLLTPTNL